MRRERGLPLSRGAPLAPAPRVASLGWVKKLLGEVLALLWKFLRSYAWRYLWKWLRPKLFRFFVASALVGIVVWLVSTFFGR